MSTPSNTPATAAAPTPVTVFAAIICTAERLQLRDDGTNIFFNLNLSTAIAGTSAPAQFVQNNPTLLRMWAQTLDTTGGPIKFDVFTITGNGNPNYVGAIGQAAAPTATAAALAAPCGDRLEKELFDLITADPGLLCWDPTDPSAKQTAASAYQLSAWHQIVAHASTWPRPIPQALQLSFEVGIPANSLNGVSSVLIYPRFSGDLVSAANPQAVLPNNPWNSFCAQYSSGLRSAYQAPCLVQAQPAGLVNPATYWIQKDPGAASETTSDWRQNLEAGINNRFDYLPTLLNAIESMPGQWLSDNMSNIWKLGIQMLTDLSNAGTDPSIEDLGIADSQLLHAVETLYGYPAKAAGLTQKNNLIAAITAGKPAAPWSTIVVPVISSLNTKLAGYISGGPPNDAKNTIPVLRSLYSLLAKNENLTSILLAFWNQYASGSNDWTTAIQNTLSDQVFPSAQLHKRYLSAVAAKHSQGGLTLTNALAQPFPGRSGHTAVLDSSGNGMIVFGGQLFSNSGATSQDTWVLGTAQGSGTQNPVQSWTQVMLAPSAALPSARAGHSAVFDSSQQQMLVFGGAGAGSSLNDVWSLNMAGAPSWTAVTASGTAPAARTGHTAVYDTTNSRMIVFGGLAVGLAPNPSAASNEVWVLTNANGVNGIPAWSQITAQGPAPTARVFHTAIYDSASNRMIVFGGCAAPGGACFSDVWALSNANGIGNSAWTQMAPTGNLPVARASHSAVNDGSGNMIIFGGRGPAGLMQDTWVLSLANPAWSSLAAVGTAPPARAGHTAIYDAGRMIIFSGADGFAPDLWAVSNANGSGGKSAWTRLNPGGMPVLDAAVKAAIANWVHADSMAVATGVSAPAFVTTIDGLVRADDGLSSVSSDTPTKTERPHSIVVQVGSWSSTDASGSDVGEDLRHYAGVGLLMRKRDPATNAAGAWRCLNAADLTVTWGAKTSQIQGIFVPSRLSYRNGMKDPFLAYDNQPLIAKSPAVSLQGQFDGAMGGWQPNTAYGVDTPNVAGSVIKDPNGNKQSCTTAGVSGANPPTWQQVSGQSTQDGSVTWQNLGVWPADLFSYAPATGVYGNFYGLVFGATFEFAPFAISHGGAMPREIEQTPGTIQTAITFENYNVICQVPYRRRVPVGHLRVLSTGVTASTWKPNQSAQWPEIPSNVYPLSRDLIPQQPKERTPLLLLQFHNPALPVGATKVDPYSFNIFPPATDIQTWDRWVANGALYGAGTPTAQTRTGVWAAFHRESANNKGDTATNRIGDPAVTALLFQLQQFNPVTQSWDASGIDVWIDVSYSPLATGAQDSTSAWNAVAATPVRVTAQPGNENATPGSDSCVLAQSGGNVTVAVPAANVARLTVKAVVPDADYSGRFEQNLFDKATSISRTDSAGNTSRYWTLGTPFSVMMECPSSTAVISPATLKNSLSLSFNSGTPQIPLRSLTASLPVTTEKFIAGEFEVRRQDWRWLGRPVHDPIPRWRPWISYVTGDRIVDSAGHWQTCTTAGTASDALPAWNDAGGTTQDGTAVWTDDGPMGDPMTATDWQNWESDIGFVGPRNDFITSFVRFKSQNASPSIQTLASVDLSNDLRCQYLRFSVVAHNRYENMAWFPGNPPDSSIWWKSICIPRDPGVSAPKPAIRLVVPLMQRSATDGTHQYDLLVVGDESWFRIGGLGETLTGQVQPVLGTELTTVSVPYKVRSPSCNADAGVAYLDTGVQFQKVAANPGQGQYTVSGTTPALVYNFSQADQGVNVAISFLETWQGQQYYQYGPDQIVRSAASSGPPPVITLLPMGATLDDTAITAPFFTNTWFTARLDPADLLSWNHFKVQFRREFRPFGGTLTPVAVSTWTDAMWVQTLPDSATFKTSQTADGTIACGKIAAQWAVPSGQTSISLQPAILPTSTSFEFWYIVLQEITDAFGNVAEIYVPSEGGTPDAPLITRQPGQNYHLRIAEVQKSMAAGTPSQFNDSNFLNVPTWSPSTQYLTGQIVVDSNNNIQQVQTPGTSNISSPQPWNPQSGGSTTDQSVVWQNMGIWHGDETLRIVRISPKISIT